MRTPEVISRLRARHAAPARSRRDLRQCAPVRAAGGGYRCAAHGERSPDAGRRRLRISRSASRCFQRSRASRTTYPFGKNELILRRTPRGMALGIDPQQTGRSGACGLSGCHRHAFSLPATRRSRSAWRASRIRIGDIVGLLDIDHPRARWQHGAFWAMWSRWREREAFALIQRRDGQIAVSVTADVNADVTPAGEVRASIESGILPEIRERYGVQTQTGGQAETQGRAFADLGAWAPSSPWPRSM